MSKTVGTTELTRGNIMGWQDFYRRRDALNAAVAQGELRAGDVFTTERDLLLALHHRWSQRLTARLELAMLDADDPVDAVGEAWRQTAADNAALRDLLDKHATELRTQTEAEQRLLATTAGLTEPTDSAAEAAAIGAAFLALQRSAPTRPPRQNRVERLLRRLASA